MSEKGSYLLAVKTKESYETLAESFKDLIKEMELLTEITLDNITYPLKYFLGETGNSWLACVVLEVPMQIMLAFGVYVQS